MVDPPLEELEALQQIKHVPARQRKRSHPSTSTEAAGCSMGQYQRQQWGWSTAPTGWGTESDCTEVACFAYPDRGFREG